MPVLIQQPNVPTTPVLDVAVGGQNGFLQQPYQWTSSAPYVRQKTIALLVTAPELLKYLDNSVNQLAALKSLIELMPQKIDGLNSTLSWEFDGPAVGHAGEKFEAPTKGSRAVTAPVFEWSEKYGMAITRFWTEYGRMLLLDPDLGYPGIVANQSYISAGSPAILPEQQAMTCLFIEPDITMTKVTKAWLVTNMMPRTGGEIIGNRETGGTGEVPTVSIEFTALTMVGKAVNILAHNYLSTLRLQDMRPLELKGYTDQFDPNVAAAATSLSKAVTNSVMPIGA